MNELFPKHEAYGEGLGINPGRVVWIHDRDSVSWKDNDYWWNPQHFNEEVVLKMIRKALLELTGADSPEEAWEKIFEHHNSKKGVARKYQNGEKIAIKVNMNGSGEWSDDFSGRSHMDYTNPILVKSLLVSLVKDAGIKSENIFFFDVARIFPDYFKELCSEEELRKVNFIDRSNAVADKDKKINWSKDFSSTKNFLPTCLTESDYLINLASLKGHCFGVTLLAKNHFGSFINYRPDRGPEAADLHGFLISGNMNEYSPLVDLLANREIKDKTILYGYDALISTQTEGTNINTENSKWLQDPFNNDYTKSFFLSQDPLALDSVGIDLLSNEPAIVGRNYSLRGNRAAENYLHEASQLQNPPSGTVYYNGAGERVNSLGVHEHWKDSKSKQYSRNLGLDEGIELIYIDTTNES